jgi:hypothetical protein
MSSNTSPRASSVWPEMPFMRGPVGAQRLRELLPVLRDVRAKTAARRARVLAHEWACRRLCLILNLKDAQQWNGYVPPARDDYGSRDALIKLLHDVAAADGMGDADPELAE